MQHKQMSHPLDKLINNDNLFLMEAIIPFVDNSLRKPLILYIKVTELRLIMDSLNNADYISKCGFNKDLKNQDEVLSSLAECGFPDIARQMESMKKTMDIMNMMNSMDMMGDMNFFNPTNNIHMPNNNNNNNNNNDNDNDSSLFKENYFTSTDDLQSPYKAIFDEYDNNQNSK